MFGLYYAIIGLISGVICSFLACKKFRSQKDWFTLGQIFPVLSVIILLLLSAKNEKDISEKYFHYNDDGETVLKPIL